MSTWEEGLALDLDGGSREGILYGLLVKDLLHGASYDVEVEEPETAFSVDYLCGDEQEDDVYRLLIVAEVAGPEEHDLVRQFTEEVLAELGEEAIALMEGAEELGEQACDAVAFRAVPEDEERWDLIAPDWVAPDGAEVPFGFRPFLAESGSAWPESSVLDAHGRVVVVPFGGKTYLFGTELPDEPEHDEA